ncbi:hypothetical protein Tco_0653052 [Tanacetum coccineum]|uniref:Uncharacterized protein n=1 Tax=Tanacetum coccineum TaxID=301880 RepID=A0ABQ4WZP7_9ASTR
MKKEACGKKWEEGGAERGYRGLEILGFAVAGLRLLRDEQYGEAGGGESMAGGAVGWGGRVVWGKIAQRSGHEGRGGKGTGGRRGRGGRLRKKEGRGVKEQEAETERNERVQDTEETKEGGSGNKGGKRQWDFMLIDWSLSLDGLFFPVCSWVRDLVGIALADYVVSCRMGVLSSGGRGEQQVEIRRSADEELGMELTEETHVFDCNFLLFA